MNSHVIAAYVQYDRLFYKQPEATKRRPHLCSQTAAPFWGKNLLWGSENLQSLTLSYATCQTTVKVHHHHLNHIVNSGLFLWITFYAKRQRFSSSLQKWCSWRVLLQTSDTFKQRIIYQRLSKLGVCGREYWPMKLYAYWSQKLAIIFTLLNTTCKTHKLHFKRTYILCYICRTWIYGMHFRVETWDV